jgi:hypothetical protein
VSDLIVKHGFNRKNGTLVLKYEGGLDPWRCQWHFLPGIDVERQNGGYEANNDHVSAGPMDYRSA